MRRRILRTVVMASLSLVLPLTSSAPAQSPGPTGPGGRIVRLDPRMDRLVPPGAGLEKVADGFTWVEGPVWDRRAGHLLVSDIPKNAVYRWAPGSGVILLYHPNPRRTLTPLSSSSCGAFFCRPGVPTQRR